MGEYVGGRWVGDTLGSGWVRGWAVGGRHIKAVGGWRWVGDTLGQWGKVSGWVEIRVKMENELMKKNVLGPINKFTH